jgi:uroporphyrinogen decarboxylase
MVEGGSTREFKKIKRLLYTNPTAMHLLLNKLAIVVTDYLNAQIDAGAQVVQIFDTWGGVLSHDRYLEFSLAYIQKIIAGLKLNRPDGSIVPVIAFTKGGAPWLEAISQCGCHAVGLDWTVDLGVARAKIGSKVALQGNMDPNILLAPIPVIEQEVKRLLGSYGQHSAGNGHVFNLGHGITPDVEPEHAAAFIEAVKQFSPHYHQ